MSNSLKGVKHPHLGRSQSGSKNNNFGRVATEETREKMRRSQALYWNSKEGLEKAREKAALRKRKTNGRF
jgi:hypothetical protein